MPTPLTDDEFRLFSEWLTAEYGLRFGPERREILRARLEPIRAALNLDSFERLLFRVRFHSDREAVRRQLISNVTNNESYFFRESKQLDVLRDELLEELALQARREQRPLRLASVGCAAGEEAYTLAILARDRLGPGSSWAVTGVDVDEPALERARAGVYRAHAFRGVDEATRDRYFEAVPEATDRWRLIEPLRAAARFQQANLVDPGWPDSLPQQDVVFCRNVLIYFDDQAMRRAADNLYRVVRPGGFLFLGHAESLTRIPTRFAPERRPGALFYSKAE